MSHRERVGGLWQETGQLQLNFMVSQGLEPYHKLLDIGCGCLRGGVHFIKYLGNGCYFGIDRDNGLIEAGIKEAIRTGVDYKRYSLDRSEQFEFDLFGTQFDFAIAQSLFTHLNLNEILLCLVNVEKVLKPQGRLYASFFTCANKADYAKIIEHHTTDDETVYTQAAFSRSMHYTFDQLWWAGNWAGLHCDYIGDWGHPRRQEMVVYYR